jgi:hypothetical protein
MNAVLRRLFVMMTGMGIGYGAGRLFRESEPVAGNGGKLPVEHFSGTGPDSSAEKRETNWAAALKRKSLDEIDLVACGVDFVKASVAARQTALDLQSGSGGAVVDWFTALHRAAAAITAIPPNSAPVGTRATFNALLLKSPATAADQLREWMNGTWEERAFAFALLAESSKSPGLARLCMEHPDLPLMSIDPSLPIRSLCFNTEFKFDDAKKFAASLKGDLFQQYAEGNLNTRAYRENLISPAEYIGFGPKNEIRLARLKLWARETKEPTRESMTEILKLFADTPTYDKAAEILASKGYAPATEGDRPK